MRFRILFSAVAGFVLANAALAEEQEIVVSATSLASDRNEVGSSISVIDGEVIEELQQRGVAEALRGVPGADVVRSGGLGGNTAVFLRGANSEHTLVLIDGIEANSPISASRAYNFANLAAENIDRIEILRGPQSPLYGSDALGGVVQIFTKRGEGPPSLEASAEAGSYDTYIERARVSGSEGAVDYSASFFREDSGSISAADASDGNREQDEYDNTTFSARLGVEPIERDRFSLFLRHSDSSFDIDNQGGVGGDDPNRKFEDRQLFTKAQMELDVVPGVFNQIYSASFADQSFSDDNDPDSDHPGEIQRSRFDGDVLKLELRNVVTPAEWSRLLFGAEIEKERGDSTFSSDGPFGPFSADLPKVESDTSAFYAQAEIKPLELFSVALGARVDDHSEFGSELTWRVAPIVRLPTGTRIKSSVGTGFKAPSLSQLFSSFGNPDLEAEESIGLDAGLEQDIFAGLTVGAAYFRNEFDDLITFDPATFKLLNIAEAESSGMESFVRLEAVEGFTAELSYTLTDTEDESTGEALLRRARHKLSGSVIWEACEHLSLGLAARYVGDRADNDFSAFPAERATLASYTVLDLTARYALSEAVEIFARVNNLFDKEYQEVLGFGTPGAAAYGGIKVRL